MSHTSSDTLRVAAARVLRCLALVDRHVPMLEASGAVAGLAVLLRTGTRVVKLAACCALSNVANSPRAGPLTRRPTPPAPDADRAIPRDAPALGIAWGVAPQDAILSDKDRRLPPLAELGSVF
mgnify:CR=1 FL=1